LGEVQLALNALQQQRDAEVVVAQQAEAARTRLFEAVRAVYERHLDEIDRFAGLNLDSARLSLSARQGLFQQIEAVHGQIAEAHTRHHAAEQAVQQAEAAQRDALLSQAQGTTQSIVAGQAQANQLRQSNGEFLTNGTHRLAAMLVEAKLNALRLEQDRNAQDMELMKYQADASNNLMVGLFTFQERRDDMYPSLELIAQLVNQLGDTGASWISP
jgi:hypothetical protein